MTREPPLYGNRIHVEDAAGLLALLLQRDREGIALDALYLGVDDDPAPLDEVVDWLRARLGITFWSDEAQLRRAGSKRCSTPAPGRWAGRPATPAIAKATRPFSTAETTEPGNVWCLRS